MLLKDTFNKDREVIFENAIEKLMEKTDITNMSQGGIARSILEIFADEFDMVYNRLAVSHLQALVSHAEGPWLDEIGKLLSCERRAGETDENYQYRIVHQNQTLATANRSAVRLACLGVTGVNDVEIKRFLRGTGSFDVYVITENPNTPQSVLDDVQETIDDMQALGNDGRVASPDLVEVQININLIFRESTDGETKRRLRGEAEREVIDYINEQRMGGEIIIKQLINRVMDLDTKNIHNMFIDSIYIDNEQVFIRDLSFNWDERTIAQEITVN